MFKIRFLLKNLSLLLLLLSTNNNVIIIIIVTISDILNEISISILRGIQSLKFLL
jgi:hypothetical protein